MVWFIKTKSTLMSPASLTTYFKAHVSHFFFLLCHHNTLIAPQKYIHTFQPRLIRYRPEPHYDFNMFVFSQIPASVHERLLPFFSLDSLEISILVAVYMDFAYLFLYSWLQQLPSEIFVASIACTRDSST